MKIPLETNIIRKIRTASFALITILIIFTPYFIKDGFSFLEEEVLEAVIIVFLFLTEFLLNWFFEKEIEKREKNLNEAWKHVGKVNLTIEKFQEAFFDLDKYPESKKDFQKLLSVMAEKILGIVNCSFVMFRVLETENLRTLSEHTKTRLTLKENKIQLGNKDLIEGNGNGRYKIISSSAKNTKIKAFCVIQSSSLDENQKIFVQKIVNDLATFYLVFSSEYYRR